MSLKRDDFETAVTCLLCPRHYEYLLFIQAQLEKDPSHLAVHKHKRAEDVIRMVHTARPRVPTFGVSDALEVLDEAMRRLAKSE